jgi:hypothetical protein
MNRCYEPCEAIEGVETAKGKGQGRMMSWSWLDGQCHSKVAGMLLGESIDVTSTLPVVRFVFVFVLFV